MSRAGSSKILLVSLLATLLALASAAPPAAAFCGFYVAKADTDLFNEASKVVIVRDGERTVLTMVNDYQGEPEQFALVVPVPTFLERGQIHVGNQATIDHLDAYTSPRLVEYYDDNPCQRRVVEELAVRAAPSAASKEADSLGVNVEAEYTVGEYDIVILSAEESRGLETWLRANDYSIPEGASEVLADYIAKGMRFFVARVNLEEQQRLGFSFLRPLQIAFEYDKFMLPIRLGMVNARGPQELFVFLLTRTGRVETANYPTVQLPSDVEVPLFVKEDFADFYRDMFAHQVAEHDMEAVFLEYAWDMAWCDPCAAQPLTPSELRELGVFWVEDGRGGGPIRPMPGPQRRPAIAPPQPQNVYVTRLHLRYDDEHFPEDLKFKETHDRTNFQGRYVLRHPWTGSDECPAATDYRQRLKERYRQQARNLAEITGWELEEIRQRMDMAGVEPSEDPWWKSLWPGE